MEISAWPGTDVIPEMVIKFYELEWQSRSKIFILPHDPQSDNTRRFNNFCEA